MFVFFLASVIWDYSEDLSDGMIPLILEWDDYQVFLFAVSA